MDFLELAADRYSFCLAADLVACHVAKVFEHDGGLLSDVMRMQRFIVENRFDSSHSIQLWIVWDAVWLIQQTLEGVLADIVKRMSGDLPEQHIPHGQFFDFLILCPHCILGVGQNAVKAADHGQGQDDLAVFVGLVHPGQLIGDGPNKPRLFMDIRA